MTHGDDRSRIHSNFKSPKTKYEFAYISLGYELLAEWWRVAPLDAEQMMANSSERKLLQIGLDCEKGKEGKEWER